MTFTLPKFKNPANYLPYKEQSLNRWSKTLWKLLIIIALLEISSIIQIAFLSEPNWSARLLQKYPLWGYFIIVIGGRALALKKIRRNRLLFVDITDFLIFLLLIGLILALTFIPSPPPVLSPVWANVEDFRFFATYLVLSATFFSWFYQVLVITAIIVWAVVLTEVEIPGYEMQYIPTYIAVVMSFAIFGYAFEAIRRDSFESEMVAFSKEKVWKEILNELPEGVIVVNRTKQVIYHNSAAKTSLKLDPTFLLTNLDSLNQHLDI